MTTNLFTKLQSVKTSLLSLNLKKSGKNAFAGFDYYELSDILPSIVKLCNEVNVFTVVSFNNEVASLTAINGDNPTEVFTITSPMRDLELKGCNQIQALGGVETYQRRYLYMAMFDIVEPDSFDSTAGKKETVNTQQSNNPMNRQVNNETPQTQQSFKTEVVELQANDGSVVQYKKAKNKKTNQTFWCLVNPDDASKATRFISEADMNAILRG